MSIESNKEQYKISKEPAKQIIASRLDEAKRELAEVLNGKKTELSPATYNNLRDRRNDPSIAPYWSLVVNSGLLEPRDLIALKPKPESPKRSKPVLVFIKTSEGSANDALPEPGAAKPGQFQRKLYDELRVFQTEHPDESVVLKDLAKKLGRTYQQTSAAFHRLEQMVIKSGEPPLPLLKYAHGKNKLRSVEKPSTRTPLAS